MNNLGPLHRICAVCLTLIGVVTFSLAPLVGLWTALGLYAGTVTLLVGTLVMFDGLPAAILVGVSAVTLGPLSGPVLLLASSPLRWPNDRKPEIALPAPTPAERIFREISQGRRKLAQANAVPSMEEVFTSGDLQTQQKALAAIAHRFAPELRPALDRALASDIPAVRVQSAAVLAHLRDAFADRARRILARKTELTTAELDAEIQAISASGFVDQGTITNLLGVAHSATASAALNEK